ncbi:NAD-dependent epimerase/dehydratase family protein [Mumia zhuanghuii]|uniref:NAD-dependent epimerase/dehydratase family protein n=2 Tax=Mumia TaxID=1546255 RepID=A0ABW1QJ67_9ACTN|nr:MULTISPECIES: NAD-dependent epimerase/dehydratase family protein [Mumia]KAA1425346.1 NAD-dependent epimerase/dehydratase family protein [Mumia zhuanghuii]
MKVVVTGASGFLGWHLRCRLRALGGYEVVPVARATFGDLDEAVRGADAVVHVAGVNRAESDREITEGNIDLARRVRGAVVRAGQAPRIVFANSVQAGNGTPYGEAKATASQVLRDTAAAAGSPYVDVVLPNLFGEHGRPHYNSFVASFIQQVVAGDAPTVLDRDVELLHAQDAAAALVAALTGPARTEHPPGTTVAVTEVLARLQAYDASYACGDLPALDTRFTRQLFNTYRAVAFERRGPFALDVRADDRGPLVETVRAHGGGGQSFVSTTAPGARRGEHFHLEKLERFVVVRGRGRIRLRRLFSDEVVTYDVTGDHPVAVDMPTMWAHDLTNVGVDDLVTAFWSDTVFDPRDPDTFAEPVDVEVVGTTVGSRS